jgi:hypothetical protein
MLLRDDLEIAGVKVCVDVSKHVMLPDGDGGTVGADAK